MKFRIVAAVLVAPVAALALAGAQNAGAQSNGSGYVGKGQLVVQTAVAGIDKLTVGGDIALEERGQLIRLDVLSLAIPGQDAVVSAVLGTQLFPPGGFTVVYDRAAATYTVWSNARRAYYSNATARTAKPSATAPPLGDAIGAAGDLFAPLAFAKGLRDDTAFTASVSLVGHGTVNGHPATGVDYQYARTTRAGEKTDVHGRLQLADDLDDVPVQITASVKLKSIPQSSLRLDLTSIAKQSPSEGDFVVPAGYTRTADLGGVLGKTLAP